MQNVAETSISTSRPGMINLAWHEIQGIHRWNLQQFCCIHNAGKCMCTKFFAEFAIPRVDSATCIIIRGYWIRSQLVAFYEHSTQLNDNRLDRFPRRIQIKRSRSIPSAFYLLKLYGCVPWIDGRANIHAYAIFLDQLNMHSFERSKTVPLNILRNLSWALMLSLRTVER